MILVYTTGIEKVSETPGGRRQAELAAVRRLTEKAFPFEAVLAHYPDGAPFIENHPEIHISISHSSSTCVMAVSDQPVGIDIETPRAQLARVKDKFLNTEEAARIEADDAPDSLGLLLRYWTAKEAVYKLMRTPGLSLTEIILSTDMSTASAIGKIVSLSFEETDRGELIAYCTS